MDQLSVSGVKKSSVSATPHKVFVDPGHSHSTEKWYWHPIIYYSNPDGTQITDPDRRFLEFYSGDNLSHYAFKQSYYVRRSDRQPVRLKNKAVKVDVDGNLDVGGIITTAYDKVGINRTDPKEILDVNGNIRLYGKR